MQLVLMSEQVEHGDWQLTQTVLLLSGTKGEGHVETQVELDAMKKGATVVLQVRQVAEVFTQVAQLDVQGSHCMVEELATDMRAGHENRHCCL